jgi:hypothetical protein
MTTHSASRFAVVLIVAMMTVISPASGQDASGVSAQIKKLGSGSGEDVDVIVKDLAKTPQLSAELLIQELHPVEDARVFPYISRPATEHLLDCIRALRFVTGGKDFCGKTNHHFGKSELEQNRKYWLYHKDNTCVPFFATWPSRGSDYIAPVDAQKEIIKQWKDWFAREGRTFFYKPFQNPTPDQWAW